MNTVTVDASSSGRVGVFRPGTVRTYLKLLGHVVVAHRTVGWFELLVVRKLRTFEVHVAIDAFELAVDR
jgi:hypothetical protein